MDSTTKEKSSTTEKESMIFPDHYSAEAILRARIDVNRMDKRTPIELVQAQIDQYEKEIKRLNIRYDEVRDQNICAAYPRYFCKCPDMTFIYPTLNGYHGICSHSVGEAIAITRELKWMHMAVEERNLYLLQNTI